MSKKRKALKISLLILNILVILGLGFTSVFYYLKYHNVQNSNLSDDQKIAKYESEIGLSYTLPKDEKPTLGTVQDADAIKKTNPAFFKDLAKDDILLIYDKAPLVVIYRPSTKKIINSAPLKFTNKVAVGVIGSKTDRAVVDTILTQAFAASVSLSSEADAKAPLTSTIVVDATGTNAVLAAKLAAELKGKVGTVPVGQDKPAEGIGIEIYAAPASSGL